MTTQVELIQVSKDLAGVPAVREFRLTLRPGRIHALVGENGAGKSTLINILSGVLTPDAGEIILNGRQVVLAAAREARRNGIVTVHQEGDLFPDLSVSENMGLTWGLPTTWMGLID